MPIPVECPQCRGAFQVADKFAGRKIRCPKCKAAVIEIAAVAPESAAPSPPEDLLSGLDDVFADEITLAPPPKRRSSASGQQAMRTLLMVGGGLLGVVVLIGGLAIAGLYAWDVASQSSSRQAPPTPEAVALEGEAGSDSSVSATGAAPFAADSGMTDPNQSQGFRPKNYPIELTFPAGPIKREQVAGLEQFRWEVPTEYDVSRGVFTEVKLIIVPRTGNDTDKEAIEAAKQRVRPLPPDESQVKNPRQHNTMINGHPAFMVMFEMPSRRTRNFGVYVSDQKAVCILLATADANLPPYKWQEIVQSIRFPRVVAEVPPVKVEPPKVAAAPKPKPTMPEPPKAASRTRSILDSPGIAAEVAAFWSGGVKMRSSLHPFEIEFPSNKVIAFPKARNEDGKKTAVHYLQRLDSGLVDGEFILTNDLTRFFATVVDVRVGPRPEDKTDEELVKSLIDTASRGIAQGVLMEAKETQHEGYIAVDMASAIESDIAGVVVFERYRVILHPTGVYLVMVRGKKASAGGDRFINSFHFLDEPGKPGDGSRLIPVAVFDGALPTRRNLAGQADPDGRYFLWEEIPVQ
ncbi:zinc-ribbon domain-containing protein [Blastopirellula sp. J2-11]|uniref:zinc-ribbon domain-containing protein n=1 Tax=Blastopirellula sp. J2-11 TaxID=2943192 RepID=UPI0021C6E49E|nr:zinc-ribbon domain-containing protein [Blastopirellula sp. J2-11]UUO05603.1 zinc-ribbon domain-containing protein [Blastopirellula sp. J2-11]